MALDPMVASNEDATFSGQSHTAGVIWPVVLAAGAGRRLAKVTGGAPKQFWRPAGRASLLEATLTRVSALGAKKYTTIVVDDAHRDYVSGVSHEWRDVQWVYQPTDRGTAAGVLLAISPVLEHAPDQLVLLTPSDHGIVDSEMFRRSVLDAAATTIRGIADLVLFGISPMSSCADYGWIVPGALCAGQGRDIRRIAGFCEKPAPAEVPALVARRALWSTMVLVARASSLRQMFATHVPQLADTFAKYLKLPVSSRAGFLQSAYETLPVFDFSRDVLAKAPGLAVQTWPASIGWADLGTPERLQDWMQYAMRHEAPSQVARGVA